MENRPLKRRIKYQAIYASVKFVIFISNILPRVFWLRFFGMLGSWAYYFSTQSRQRVITHLNLAFANKKTQAEIVLLSKQVYKMLGKNGGDILRGLDIRSIENLKKITEVQGAEHIDKALAMGRGVIIMTAHLGAFELVGSYAGLMGYKPLIIGTAMKDERLNEMLVENRTSRGAIAIERGKESVKLVKTLKSGGTILILIDQDTKVKSRFVNFFGMPAATPIGATLLALRTGAIVVPVFIHLREDHKQEINILPGLEFVQTGDEEKDLVTYTQTLTNIVEKAVRQNPAQWVWMHERWKTKPGEEIV